MTIVIADDEQISVAGLESVLQEIYGNKLTLLFASNGEKLVETVRNQPVDLAFIDIKMPVIDGITALSIVHEEKPSVQCVMLSGYAEFNYAREAMAHGAIDYLLKPVSRQLLIETLVRAKKYSVKHRTDLNTNFAYKILQQYSERIQSEETIDFHENRCIQLYQFYFDSCQDIEEKRNEFRAISEDFFKEDKTTYAICCPFENSICLFITIEKSERQRYASYISNLVAEQQLHAYSIFMDTLYDIVETSYFIDKISPLRILTWKKRIVPVPVESISPEELEIVSTLLELQTAILTNNVLNYRMLLAKVCDFTPTERWKSEEYRNISAFFSFNETVEDYSSLCTLLRNDARRLNFQSETKDEKLVLSAKNYIGENYDKIFGVDDIARAVGITPNYLSTVFRKTTGVRLNEYIIGIKLEQAKKIIQGHPHITVIELAKKVGFTSSRYFSEVFTKNIGLRPSEYIDAVEKMRLEQHTF